MTETQNTITVKGLEFSPSLNVGAAKWLQQASGRRLVEFIQDLLTMKGETFDITMMAQLMTALYIAQHPGVDPQEAEAAVDRLTFADMMQVIEQAKPLDFQLKDSPPAPTPVSEDPPANPTS